MERILAYAGNPPAFDTVTELEGALRTIYEPFGYLSDAEWRAMAESSVRRTDDGRITVHYDPKMVDQFRNYPDDYHQWAAWDEVEAPTLLLRGAESDLLLADVADQMTQRGPRCRREDIAGVGHAPALNVADQLALLDEFLS